MIKYRFDYPNDKEKSRLGWKWIVKSFYNGEARPPLYFGPDHRIKDLKGLVANITSHKSDYSKDIEVKALHGRKDIGLIEVYALKPEHKDAK